MSASSAGARSLYLFNTASKIKELFTVRDSSTVNMYVCGITVYDYSHIGMRLNGLVLLQLLLRADSICGLNFPMMLNNKQRQGMEGYM